MLKTLLAIMVIGFVFVGTAVFAKTARDDATLPASGEPALVDNPDCSDPRSQVSAQTILNNLGEQADKYIGLPVASTALRIAPNHVREFLAGALGLNNGQSACQTLCIGVPRDAKVRFRSCMRQILTVGGVGPVICTDLDSNPSKANQDLQFGKVTNATVATERKIKVFCALGKNWTHNSGREFWIEGRY